MLTMDQASKLSRDPLAVGAFKAIATNDELVSQIQFDTTLGKAVVYNRELALPSMGFIAHDATSVAEGTGTVETVSVPLRIIAGDVDVPLFEEAQQSEANRQRSMQVAMKLKALGRTLGNKLITGAYASGATFTNAVGGTTVTAVGPNQDSTMFGLGMLKFVLTGTLMSYRAPGDARYGTAVNVGSNGVYTLVSDNPNKYIIVTIVAASLPGANMETTVTITTSSNEFDGLLKLIPTTHAQSFISGATADGDALSFAHLDRLLDETVRVKNRLFFLGNAKLKGKLLALQRALGGSSPQDLLLPGMATPVPQYRGVPFLQSDWIPSNEAKGAATTLSSLFLVDLSFEGLSMMVGSHGMTETLDTSPEQARVMGVSVRDLGELQAGGPNLRTRVDMYTCSVLRSELAVGRVYNVITA